MNRREDELMDILRTLLRGADPTVQLIFCGGGMYPFRWISDPPSPTERTAAKAFLEEG